MLHHRIASPAMILLLLMTTAAFSVIQGSQIQMDPDGGYTGIVVKINKDVPEDLCPQILSNLKVSYVLESRYNHLYMLYLKFPSTLHTPGLKCETWYTVHHGIDINYIRDSWEPISRVWRESVDKIFACPNPIIALARRSPKGVDNSAEWPDAQTFYRPPLHTYGVVKLFK